MPQPLSKVLPGCDGWAIAIHNSTPDEHRPELAVLAMGVVSKWAVLEHSLSTLLVHLLGANPRPAMEMFASLTSTAAQATALRAVASSALANYPDDALIFEALMQVFKGVSKERNKVVHWTWGYAPDLPDAALLCEPALVTDVELSGHLRDKDMEMVLTADDILVYRKPDFDALTSAIVALTTQIQNFRVVAGKPEDHHPRALQQFRQLCNEPRLQSALAHLRKRQKNSREDK